MDNGDQNYDMMIKEDEQDMMLQKSEHHPPPDKEEEDDTRWYEFIPLGICLAILLAICIFVLIDLEGTIQMFEDLVDFVREHPWEAALVIILIYIVIIVFMMPVTFLHIIVAIAYCKVFNSFWLGFLVATLVIFIGCMLGALVVIYLGRYLIADYIKKQIYRSKGEWAKKFKVVDLMFKEDGILFVALLRLMFIGYGITSYVISATSISVLDYMIGTSAYIVKIMLIVFLGCSIYQGAEDAQEGK